MQRMLSVGLLALLMTACSSGVETHPAPSLREVTAANQCMAACHGRYDTCSASPVSSVSSDTCGTGVATRRDGRCDKIDNPELRRSCQASADFCRNRSPALRCGEARDRCVSRCGG